MLTRDDPIPLRLTLVNPLYPKKHEALARDGASLGYFKPAPKCQAINPVFVIKVFV